MFEKYKKIIIFLLVMFIIGIIIFFVFKVAKKRINDDGENKNNDKKKYEVLVFIRNQTNSNPEEDRRTSMKKGYVVGVYDDGHKWSKSEKNSYLILKMMLTEKQKEKLMQSITKKKKTKSKSDEIDGEEIIGLRAYKISLKKVGFTDPKQLKSGQPFEDSVFDWSVVEKIE